MLLLLSLHYYHHPHHITPQALYSLNAHENINEFQS
jgi:hypothetical protein